MQDRLVFLIGPPRSGSAMLQRMLGSHSAIYVHPEPQIITPLAHLGYYANVDKAPYDHIGAAEAIREYVEDLPGGESDYLDACRAYTDVLYGRMLGESGKQMLLDKTPAYALVLPFLSKLYPSAKYVVLTRQPLAVLSSYANWFFDGDYDAAVDFDDILGRYVPAIAAFLRQTAVPFHRVRYEDLVEEPKRRLAEIFEFLGLPNQERKASQESWPTARSVSKWASELAGDEHKLELARQVVEPLDPDDIELWGYDKEHLFDMVSEAVGSEFEADARWKWNKHRMKRKVFLKLRRNIHHNMFGRAVKRVRYFCDVLLRE